MDNLDMCVHLLLAAKGVLLPLCSTVLLSMGLQLCKP